MNHKFKVLHCLVLFMCKNILMYHSRSKAWPVNTAVEAAFYMDDNTRRKHTVQIITICSNQQLFVADCLSVTSPSYSGRLLHCHGSSPQITACSSSLGAGPSDWHWVTAGLCVLHPFLLRRGCPRPPSPQTQSSAGSSTQSSLGRSPALCLVDIGR